MSKNKSIGVNYPIQRSNDGYFDRTYTTIEHTKSNIINVLSTKKGERIGRPQFGTELEQLLFEPMSEQIESKIREEINTAINRFLPYVEIMELSVRRDKEKKLASVEIMFTTPFVSREKEENIEILFEVSNQ